MPRRHKWLVMVDDTPEVRCALRFASRRARNTGGQLMLLRVMQMADAGPAQETWLSVKEVMRAEAQEAAEHLLSDLADEVQRDTGQRPDVVIREGQPRAELLKLIDEDSEIRILVLAAAPGPDGPGPLVSALAGQLSGNLRIPVTIIPGSLTNAQIDELT